MRTSYSPEYKEQAIQKLLRREPGVTVKSVADSLNVGKSTLEGWVRKSRESPLPTTPENRVERPMTTEKTPQQWSLSERLRMVITCDPLSEEGISQKCRESGLYPHHVTQWKADFVRESRSQQNSSPQDKNKKLNREIKNLKLDLNRKEKALAEAAALLVLQKKAQLIWDPSEAGS